jgi:hypothetical protein
MLDEPTTPSIGGFARKTTDAAVLYSGHCWIQLFVWTPKVPVCWRKSAWHGMTGTMTAWYEFVAIGRFHRLGICLKMGPRNVSQKCAERRGSRVERAAAAGVLVSGFKKKAFIGLLPESCLRSKSLSKQKCLVVCRSGTNRNCPNNEAPTTAHYLSSVLRPAF